MVRVMSSLFWIILGYLVIKYYTPEGDPKVIKHFYDYEEEEMGIYCFKEGKGKPMTSESIIHWSQWNYWEKA